MADRAVTRGVIGTAGHIDHGKTTLVHALTGIDTDRLKEEKARGITIELGFAHLSLPSGRTVGVVDVPGHERYLRTMVAGAVGFDLMLLVVACDEGVKPQTREHLEVCQLLGIERGIVVITKTDLAQDDDLVDLVEDDVRRLLRRTAFEGAPVVRVSARHGHDLDVLRRAIDDALAALPNGTARDAGGLLRVPIDRVFTMKGFGSVVTGTLWSGEVAVDDEVALFPDGGAGPAKVRGLQVHGQSVERAHAGQRVAINVGWPKERIERGQVLGHAGVLAAGRVFDARMRLLGNARRPLGRRSRVLLHAGTVQVEATLRLLESEQLQPGDEAWVEVEAATPLVLLPGDRFVLRGFELQKGYGTTLGGGEVVRVLGARSRRGARTEPAVLHENLAALRGGDLTHRIDLELERAGDGGLDRTALAQRVPCSPRALEAALMQLSSRQRAICYDRERGAFVAKRALASVAERVVARVAAHHRQAPLDDGVPRESLRTETGGDARLLHVALEALAMQGRVRVDRDRVRLLEHAAEKHAEAQGLDVLGQALLAKLVTAGLETPRIEALDPRPEAKAALEQLVKQRKVVRLKDLVFAASVVDALRTRLVAHLEQHGQIDAQGWKTLSGVSRKYGIPLAEHFDAEKVTLRVGDTRRLRQPTVRSSE